MNRTARYILGIIIVGALALWLVTVYRSCERQRQLDEATVVTDTKAGQELYVPDEDETSEELYSDDEPEATTPEEKEEDPGTGADNASGGVFADGEADIDGEFLVVAGAFILKENAEAHIRSLKNKGFDAERRVFLGSDYHSVILGNFETEGAARTVANKIGTEAYVHKKRYLKKR